MTSDGKFLIDKLDGSNFAIWKFKMKNVLMERELWEIVDGTEVLAEDADDNARRRFQQRMNKALATIVLSVSDDQIHLIDEAKTPLEAWTNLQTHFERSSLANRLFLNRKLQGLRMSNEDSMHEHVKKFKEIVRKLSAIGAPVPDDYQVTILLNSLPDSYDSLIVALESRAEGLTMEFVQERLLHEFTKRSESVSEDDQNQETKAMIGKFSKAKAKHERVRYFCNKPGHLKRDCFKYQRQIAESKQKKMHGHAKHQAKATVKQGDEYQMVAFPAATHDRSDQRNHWIY
jgi:hypothetical protein